MPRISMQLGFGSVFDIFVVIDEYQILLRVLIVFVQKYVGVPAGVSEIGVITFVDAAMNVLVILLVLFHLCMSEKGSICLKVFQKWFSIDHLHVRKC